MDDKTIVKVEVDFNLNGRAITYITCKVQAEPLNEIRVTERFIRDHKILETAKKNLQLTRFKELEKIGL